jgi:hypothetical protein
MHTSSCFTRLDPSTFIAAYKHEQAIMKEVSITQTNMYEQTSTNKHI